MAGGLRALGGCGLQPCGLWCFLVLCARVCCSCGCVVAWVAVLLRPGSGEVVASTPASSWQTKLEASGWGAVAPGHPTPPPRTASGARMCPGRQKGTGRERRLSPQPRSPPALAVGDSRHSCVGPSSTAEAKSERFKPWCSSPQRGFRPRSTFPCGNPLSAPPKIAPVPIPLP